MCNQTLDFEDTIDIAVAMKNGIKKEKYCHRILCIRLYKKKHLNKRSFTQLNMQYKPLYKIRLKRKKYHINNMININKIQKKNKTNY